ELVIPTVNIPGDVKIKPLNYRWLSQATSLPRHVVQGCVQETILLYSFQLRKGQHLAFAFKDIGVLSCKDGVLCMRFYYECVVGLESKASQIALLHT
ncbi:CCD81 protein, partial [Nyctiprogne leucopyga]|nr:CCD81 protein [Nyctiprogne leucopyga]